MEAYDKNGGNPSAALLAPSMTNQEYLYSNVSNPSLLSAPRINFGEMDYWLERRSARQDKNYEDESKALQCSKFWGVSQCKAQGNFLSFYLENNGSDRTRLGRAKTVYIGTFEEEEDAARAHDLATLAITFSTSRTNFPVAEYKEDLKIMRSMCRTECLDYIRRKLTYVSAGNGIGFRGVSMVPQCNNRWLARLGRGAGLENVYIGTFDTGMDAARAYDAAAILLKGPRSQQTNFQNEHYDEIGILEILRRERSNFNANVLNILERRWMERFGDQEEGSSDTAEGSSIVDLPVNCSQSFQQFGQIDSSSNIDPDPSVDSNVSNVIMQTNIGTMPTIFARYDFSSLLKNGKNPADGESGNAMSMPSQLVQTVVCPVSHLYPAIENQDNVDLPRYHDLDRLVRESNEHLGLLSCRELQNHGYFEWKQNLTTSLQGYQYPEFYDDASIGSNESLGFNANLQGTAGSGPEVNGEPPLSFPLYESPSTMELETPPPLLDAMFQMGSNSNQMGVYQNQAFSPSKFSNNAEESVHETMPIMRYQFDNQFEINASELVGDSWFQDDCQPVVEDDPNMTYLLDNLVELEPVEFISNSAFQKTCRIMNVDEVLATMETDKCFDGAASVGNCVETNEGYTQKDLSADTTAVKEELVDHSTLMDDPGFSK